MKMKEKLENYRSVHAGLLDLFALKSYSKRCISLCLLGEMRL